MRDGSPQSDVDLAAAGAELVAAIQYLRDLHGGVVLNLSYAQIVILVAQLQLALRNPGNSDTFAGGEARKLVDGIIDNLDRERPGIGRILRLGDYPRGQEGWPP